MSKLIKITAMTVAATAALTSLTACLSDADRIADDKGSVYYLSFKPRQDQIWQDVAKVYTEETGVEAKVVTAVSGTYKQTLKSEVARSDVSTLFQIDGPVGLRDRIDYTASLSETDLYKNLLGPFLAVTKDRKIYGVPYVVEGYGITYNQKIMDKYFTLSDMKVKSIDEVTNFDALKAITNDIQAKKGGLDIKGVLASTFLKPGEDWRWQAHLVDLSIHSEHQDIKVEDSGELKPTYNEQFKNILDLYLTGSIIDPKPASFKAVTDSIAEFTLGEAAMVQNGNWAFGQVSEVAGSTIAAENVKMPPAYAGRKDEEKQGLNIGTESCFSVNPQVSEADQKASIDFVNWLVPSEKGKKLMVENLGFVPPFDTFMNAEQPSDSPVQEIVRYMSDPEKKSIPQVFTTFPSQTFREGFGVALSQYVAGQMEWNKVVKILTTKWKAEEDT